ncbi:PREDICTED: P2Y purinoceptor 4-like [Nanorana parkeri]|uniref:P2Y purinoceptor 4-like n=1 Tax=Nanorana parkeri TaxID=125878 RepID=UPI000854AFF8|nr:PREDICTED: P2Y purinoceptor 4-like [Nanorana parkeri]
MLWSRVVPEVTHFARLDRPPDILVLHVGGNDLGVRSMRELIRDVKFDFLGLRRAFPQMVIVWSDIVSRQTWRLARSVAKLNKARIKFNTSLHLPPLLAFRMAFEMLNSSGNSSGCQPQHINPFIPIFLSFIFFIGFVLNCISLWIFWFKVKDWTSTVVLQFNLAISDAIITPAAPLIIIYSLTDHWTYGLFFCQFKVFLLSTHMYGSIYFLTLISIHRYFSVAHNIKRPALTRKPFITKLCLFVWGCLLCQGIPFFFVLKTSEVHGVTKCLSIHQTEHAVLFFVWNCVILFSGLLIPFSITLVCYTLLSRHLLKINPVNTLSKVMVSTSVQTIFISLIIFIICYIPVHITRTMGVAIILFFPTSCSLLENIEIAYYITWMMSGTNCCMDPILYCYASDRFKYTFTSWCTFLQRRHERNITDDDHGNPIESSMDIYCHGAVTMNSKETVLSGSGEL